MQSVSNPASPALLVSLPILVATILFFTHYVKWVPSDWLFAGLWHYSCNDPNTRTVKTIDQAPVSKKQAKKQQQLDKRLADYGAEQLIIVPTTKTHLARLDYMREADNLLLFGLMLMVNAAGTSAVMHIFHVPDNKIWVVCGFMAMGMAMHCLVQTTFMYHTVVKRDKIYMALFGAAACVATWFVLATDLGQRYFAFDITAASAEAAERCQLLLDDIHSRQLSGSAPPKPISPQRFTMAIVLTMMLVAATLSALMMLPAMKAARLIWQASCLPRHAERSLGVDHAWHQLLLMRLAFLLPGLTAMLWVNPMVEVLGVPLPLLLYIQPAAVLVTALAFLAALRPLIQSHLHLGALEWFRLKHELIAGDYLNKLQNIASNVRFVLQLTGRVAVNLAAPAVLLLVLGLLLVTRPMPIAWAAKELDQQPSELWRLLVGFPAWWLCCCWFGYGSLMMAFQRLGLISSNRVYFE